MIRQTAIFDPINLFGLMSWYGILTLDQFIFSGMLAGIARAAKGHVASEQTEKSRLVRTAERSREGDTSRSIATRAAG